MCVCVCVCVCVCFYKCIYSEVDVLAFKAESVPL